MRLHDSRRETSILYCVLSFGLDENCRWRNAEGCRGASHHLGFDEFVVRRPPSKDKPGSYATLIFVYAFGDSCQLLGSRVAIGVDLIAEDNNGIEAVSAGVRSWSHLAGYGRPCEKDEDQARRENDHTTAPAHSLNFDGLVSVAMATGGGPTLCLSSWPCIDQKQLLHP